MRDAGDKGYLLGILTLIATFNFAERLILGIVSQSLKVDLSLTDFDLGLLGGLTFAVFYSTMGIPIARWADRGNRVTILAATTGLWAVAVMLCGAAQSLVQLVLIRIAVGIGEAGAQPVTNSIIPDYFARAERPRAMAIYALSNPLCLVVGYGIAGWITQLYGWRATFVALGLPGLVLALLTATTLGDPRRARGRAAGFQTPSATPMSSGMRQISVMLWRNVTFRHLAMAYIISAFFNTGIFQWLPVFFIRSYGLQTGEVGTWFAVIVGGGGLLGNYIGGELASRFAGDNERLQMKVMALLVVVTTLLSFGIYLTHSLYVAFGIFAVYSVLALAVTGPLLAIKQTIVPRHLRAISFALVFMLANLIGTGIGPMVGGELSDLLRPVSGKESLRYALLILSPGFLWVAWHIWQARKTVVADVTKAEFSNEEPVPGQGAAAGPVA